jgi:hypothetical protein
MPRKKPTEQGPACEHCLYWKDETRAEDEVRYGSCRRYPPTLFAVVDQVTGENTPYPMQTQTEPHEWCGEFKGRQ